MAYDEVMYRIDKEMENQTGILDLSKCNLSSIPAEISKMPWLIRLDLSNNQINKIECLETLTSLTGLWLSNNQISKIEGLETLTSLKELYLSNNQINKIEGLEKLTSLIFLWGSDNQINKIEGLETLTTLTSLNLSKNQISKIEGLEMLTSLTDLWLENNQLIKLEGLETLTSLTNLNLSNNQISKLEGLETLTSLKNLSLPDNQISKLEGLETLTSLKTLRLYNNQLSKIEGLESLTSLQLLLLSNNQISKIEGLESLTSLQVLNLPNNQISKIEGLENHTFLTDLYLSNNKLEKSENIIALKDLKALTLLRIEENEVTKTLSLPSGYNESHLGQILNFIDRFLESNKIDIVLPLKILLLGNHGSGKSTLLNYILTNEIKTQESTHILNIEYLKNDNKELQLPKAVFFDFGGQDYYHGMYKPFLSKEALYLILWKHSTNKNERIANDKNGIACHHFNLQYWLAQKEYLEKEVYSDDNNVINDQKFVIQTHCESDNANIEPELGIIGIEKLKFELCNEDHYNSISAFEKLKIISKIEEMLNDEKYQKEEPEWYIKFLNFLIDEGKSNNRLRDITELLSGSPPIYDTKQEDKIESLKIELEVLHRRGLVLYYRKLNDLYYWPGPASFARYVHDEILDKKEFLFNLNGIIPKVRLDVNNMIEKILIDQKVIFYDGYNEYIVIPGFLKLTSEDNKYEKTVENVDTLIFQLQFLNYLPFGYINQLISSIGQQGKHLHYWRDEIYFIFENVELRINLDYKNLRISVYATKDPQIKIERYLFYLLLAEYWNLNLLNYSQYLSFEKGKIQIEEFQWEDPICYPLLNYKKVFTKLECRPNDLYISLDEEVYVEYCSIWTCQNEDIPAFPLKNNVIDTNARNITKKLAPFKELIKNRYMETEKRKLKAFISYSKYDGEEYKDATKGAGVNYLEKFKEVLSGLTEHKEILEAWDDTRLIAGEDWDARIVQELNSADIIFLLISSSFANTMYIKDKELKIACIFSSKVYH